MMRTVRLFTVSIVIAVSACALLACKSNGGGEQSREPAPMDVGAGDMDGGADDAGPQDVSPEPDVDVVDVMDVTPAPDGGVDTDDAGSDVGVADVMAPPMNCDDVVSSYVAVENPVEPPFGGTLFISPDIMTEADPTAFQGLTYTGQDVRQMFDRRTGAFGNYDAHLFEARFGRSVVVEVQVNPEFGRDEAEVQAVRYATAIGRMPAFLFRDLETVWIHRGNDLAGGGNNNLLIHTDQGDNYIRDGILEELFLHEGAHTSLDAYHATDPAWIAAQQADGTFLSTYARDNPTREDVAESLGPWMAIRYFRDRIDPALAVQIEATIPNRIRYLDCAGLMPGIVQ